GLEVGLGLLEGARQRRREIAADGGLLGDDEGLGHEEDTLAKGAKGDTAPRDGASLAALPRARQHELAAGQAPLPPPRDRARARAARGRLRARGEPHVELRPVAARAAALPAALASLHGEVGALLVAARVPPERRRRVSGAPRRRR